MVVKNPTIPGVAVEAGFSAKAASVLGESRRFPGIAGLMRIRGMVSAAINGAVHDVSLSFRERYFSDRSRHPGTLRTDEAHNERI